MEIHCTSKITYAICADNNLTDLVNKLPYYFTVDAMPPQYPPSYSKQLPSQANFYNFN